MTPVKRTKDGIEYFSGQWKAQFNGEKPVWISCKQLGVPKSIGESWRAANGWWEQYTAGKTLGIKPGSPEALAAILSAWTGKKLTDIADDEIAPAWHAMMDAQFPMGKVETKEQANVVRFIVGEERFAKVVTAQTQLDTVVNTLFADSPPDDMSVGVQVERYLVHLELKVADDDLSAGSFDNYQRCIRHFETFFGKFASIHTITAMKMQDYKVYLSQGGDKVLRLNVAKMFCHYLGNNVPTFVKPMNLADLNFGERSKKKEAKKKKQLDKKKDFWTQEEFRQAYQDAQGIKRLYLLLAANCGFYGSDMGEIDNYQSWEEILANGCVTRKRTKTNAREGTWYFWPETLELLKVHHAELSDIYSKKLEGRKLKKKNKTRSIKGKLPKPLMQLRHTSCHAIKNSKSYLAAHADYWLGDVEDKRSVTNYSEDDAGPELAAYLHKWYFGS